VSKFWGSHQYKLEQIAGVAKKLRGLPAIEKKNLELTQKEAIRMLSKEIIALQKKGYALKQIIEVLHGEGMPITLATLKGYMQAIKKEGGDSKEVRGGGEREAFTPVTDSMDI
jgi:hypothetical protein